MNKTMVAHMRFEEERREKEFSTEYIKKGCRTIPPKYESKISQISVHPIAVLEFLTRIFFFVKNTMAFTIFSYKN